MKVAEKFISINGEGTRAGETACFIRFCGCNLKCTYCDTSWANEKDCPYVSESPKEIFDYIKNSGIRNVTLTGGEPLLQEEMPQLLELLCADDTLSVEIETNGAVDIGRFCTDKRPIFTMDYKLPSSGYEKRMITDNFAYLVQRDTVKFVSGSIEDLQRAKEVIEKYDLAGRCNLYLSPVFGSIEPEKIVEYMIKNKMNGIKLQIQMHKVIWDPNKRGV